MALNTGTAQYSFSETQKFLKIWKWLTAIVAIIVILRITTLRVYKNYDASLPIGAVIVVFAVLLFVFLLLALMKLETKIDEQGIWYKYVPLHREPVLIRWSDVQEAYVRKYNPVLEYGGWGMRMNVLGKGRAYNVSGNMGLQIVYDNGKKLLLGTQRPEEIKDILNRLTEAGIIVGKSNNADRF
jgi:hypothetical protein